MLRIRRPHDYSPAAAKALGPTEPSSYINLALLRVVGGLVDEASAPRLSVSGLPKHLTDEQVGDPAGRAGSSSTCCAGFIQLRCVTTLPAGPVRWCCAAVVPTELVACRVRAACLAAACWARGERKVGRAQLTAGWWTGWRSMLSLLLLLLQVRAVIGSFGQLKAFSLLLDAEGQSTGAALAEFQDPSVLNAAIAGLSVLTLGPERLTVARAANQEHVLALQQLIQQQQAALLARLTGQPLPGAVATVALPSAAPAPAPAAAAAPAAAPPLSQEAVPPPLPAADAALPSLPAGSSGAVAGAGAAAAASDAAGGVVASYSSSLARTDSGAGALCVVRLEHMVTRSELLDDEEYEDILDDTREEVAKYGPLKQVSEALNSGAGAGWKERHCVSV